MKVTRIRVILADLVLLLAVLALFFATAGFSRNVLAFSLVIALLLVRSVFWHWSWYRQTGRIY